MDVMAFDAAAALGFERADYDFTAVIMPRCPQVGSTGFAWIGAPGMVLNLHGNNYDAAFAHELVSDS